MMVGEHTVRSDVRSIQGPHLYHYTWDHTYIFKTSRTTHVQFYRNQDQGSSSGLKGLNSFEVFDRTLYEKYQLLVN